MARIDTVTSIETPQSSPKGWVQHFIEELIADIAITAAIAWGLVLLGEPLTHVLRSPLFIVLTIASLGHLADKKWRRATSES